MKKRIFNYLVPALLGVLVFTSCGDDKSSGEAQGQGHRHRSLVFAYRPYEASPSRQTMFRRLPPRCVGVETQVERPPHLRLHFKGKQWFAAMGIELYRIGLLARWSPTVICATSLWCYDTVYIPRRISIWEVPFKIHLLLQWILEVLVIGPPLTLSFARVFGVYAKHHIRSIWHGWPPFEKVARATWQFFVQRQRAKDASMFRSAQLRKKATSLAQHESSHTLASFDTESCIKTCPSANHKIFLHRLLLWGTCRIPYRIPLWESEFLSW